ncbi:hypothetical protein AB1Y20_011023 [Prymnesium parvum]|uniref:Secreted protein n=1 Tax=Prymnesium parvum TaxID=97485 RepID=A0AB34IND4_PRYPA
MRRRHRTSRTSTSTITTRSVLRLVCCCEGGTAASSSSRSSRGLMRPSAAAGCSGVCVCTSGETAAGCVDASGEEAGGGVDATAVAARREHCGGAASPSQMKTTGLRVNAWMAARTKSAETSDAGNTSRKTE